MPDTAETFRKYLRFTSWPIIMAMLMLMAGGVLAISVYGRSDPIAAGCAAKQTVFMIVGICGFIAATVIPYQKLGTYAYLLFGLTLAMLVLMYLGPRYFAAAGIVKTIVPSVRGAHRWIDLGITRVQPSEIAKLTYIILLAFYLRYGDHYRKLSGLIVPFVLTLAPMALILKQPDLGTCLLFLPTLYFMLFMAGAKLKHLLGIVAVATLLLAVPIVARIDSDMTPAEVSDRRSLAYGSFTGDDGGLYVVSAVPLALMEKHQLSRINGWLRQYDPAIAMNRGYQLRQSKMILAIGGLAGTDKWNEKNAFFRTLPDGHTDFIFAIIGGQWGLLGCGIVLGLYAVIFLCGIEIAVVTNDPFGRLLAVGVLGLMLSQLVINSAMTIGLMPITGMTLPLVSYGGSSLVVNCIALGLLVNVGQRRVVTLSKKPFEHGERKKPLTPYGPMSSGKAEE